MKRFLLIVCALTLVLTMTACKGKDKKKTADTQETAIETNKNGTPKETTPEGEVIEPTPGVDSETGIQGVVEYTDETDEDGNYIPAETTPEVIVISDGGTEKGLWPDEIPDAVPAYTNYSEMYPATLENYTERNLKWWSVSFESTEADCEAYKAGLESAGYVKGTKDVFTWGKGNYLVEVYPEAGDKFFVTLDIYEISDPALPSVFPVFETDYAIYFSEVMDTSAIVEYDCGTDFQSDVNNYLTALTNSGFTVDGANATLTKDGVTYICTINLEENILEYTFG